MDGRTDTKANPNPSRKTFLPFDWHSTCRTFIRRLIRIAHVIYVGLENQGDRTIITIIAWNSLGRLDIAWRRLLGTYGSLARSLIAS